MSLKVKASASQIPPKVFAHGIGVKRATHGLPGFTSDMRHGCLASRHLLWPPCSLIAWISVEYVFTRRRRANIIISGPEGAMLAIEHKERLIGHAACTGAHGAC